MRSDLVLLPPVELRDEIEEKLFLIHESIRKKSELRFLCLDKMRSLESYVDIREGSINHKHCFRACIIIRGVGCSWYNSSGCYICSYSGKQFKRLKAIEYYEEYGKLLYDQFVRAFKKIDWSNIPILCLYNSGSIFDPKQIPVESFIKILKTIAKTPYIYEVRIESAARHVNNDYLEILNHYIGSQKKIVIGVGLESSNEWIRNKLVNKNLQVSEFEYASSLIKNHGMELCTYVLLKPPLISESDAIKDSVNSILYSFDQGSSTVSLEAMNIQSNTIAELLFKQGWYNPPWLWSIINVLKNVNSNCKKDQYISIGGLRIVPQPQAYSKNCNECTNVILKMMREYNMEHDYDTFMNKLPNCNCSNTWSKNLKLNKVASWEDWNQKLDSLLSLYRDI